MNALKGTGPLFARCEWCGRVFELDREHVEYEYYRLCLSCGVAAAQFLWELGVQHVPPESLWNTAPDPAQPIQHIVLGRPRGVRWRGLMLPTASAVDTVMVTLERLSRTGQTQNYSGGGWGY